MQERLVTYSTFDAFKPHFDALARVGYFKIVPKPLSETKRLLHDVYRYILIFLIIVYNILQLIRVVAVRHSTDLMVDTLFILLTTINTFGKEASFNLKSRRVENIIETINGPYFAATRAHHVEILEKNAVLMARLLKLYQGAALTCCSMWVVIPIVNKIMGQELQSTEFIPFSTQKTPEFELGMVYASIIIVFQAYGHVTMDCTIVSFYAQAHVQVQILRYNLEQLVEINEDKRDTRLVQTSNDFAYEDDTDRKLELQQRLKRCVVQYQTITGFAKEIESIFGEAMVIQFFIMTWVICMTMYKIVGLSITSAEFVSTVIYLGCMLAQLFIYCYFGTQLQVESEFINESLYCSGWLSLSPRFRRQLLIMMQCCTKAIAPSIAFVIPMSLETYITVLRASYTLFTFLNR